MIQIVGMFALIAIVTSLNTGCNTAKGFGKDMENAGEKIQDKTR